MMGATRFRTEGDDARHPAAPVMVAMRRGVYRIGHMSPLVYILLYGLAVIVVSLAGGWVPIYVRLTHRRMQLGNSLVAGFMLGVALLILLPHALLAIDVEAAMGWLIAGLLVMFFLERFFAYHHHDVPPGLAIQADANQQIHQVADPATRIETGDGEQEAEAGAVEAAPAPAVAPQQAAGHVHEHRHDHAHGHAHSQGHGHGHGHGRGHHLSWAGAATGLILHSLIDGIAMAAAVFAQPAGNSAIWPGLAVFLVVALHRPLDAMTLLTLTQGPRWTTARRHGVNVLFALAVPAGAALFLLGVASPGVDHDVTVGCAVAFAAGVFLCVSLSDLLPELHFHDHDRLALSAALLLGLALAAALHLVESAAHDRTHHHHFDPHHEQGAGDR